jgi:xanthine dehydrogenase YagT iron-sulfur-binding subunit
MDKGPRKKGKTVTRRDFIKGMGGGAIAATVASTATAAPRPQAGSESPLEAREIKTVTLKVNGRSRTLKVMPRETLLSVLRDRLGLTGAKRTCNRGECGSCTVLLDGKPVYSCLTLAARLDGRSVTTVEGLARQGRLHPVQQAFIDEDGYQCGYCTPGFVMAAAGLLVQNPSPSFEEIKTGLSGNICRCGNYQKIYKAVSTAAARSRRP